SGAIPPPIVGTTSHTQVTKQRSPSVGSDAQAHTSPRNAISESLSPSSIGHVEVQQQ
ncbi:17034_t:CDS:2, partial [Racocetra persica]